MGSDLPAPIYALMYLLFQSTLPHGERPMRMRMAVSFMRFNPRSHMGSDVGRLSIYPFIPRVSTHAPAWGATVQTGRLLANQGCFNPRSRMGSDQSIPVPDYFEEVSTHAPAWGATPLIMVNPYVKAMVSTHAPAWGATIRFRQCTRLSRGFNPRSRMGSDNDSGNKDGEQPLFQPTLPHGERQR